MNECKNESLSIKLSHTCSDISDQSACIPIWLEEAKENIKKWFIAQGLLGLANSICKDGENRLIATYENELSDRSFIAVVNKFKHIEKLLKNKLSDSIGLIVGSNWGPKYIYAGQISDIKNLVLVDFKQRYGFIGEEIIKKHNIDNCVTKYLSIKQIANQFFKKLDFLYITTSFALKNSIDSYEEITDLLLSIKEQGIFYVDLPKTPYIIGTEMLGNIFKNTGFEIVYTNNHSIAAKKIKELTQEEIETQVHYIWNANKQDIPQNDFGVFNDIVSLQDNQKLIELEINNKKTQLLSLPTSVKINLSSRCNIKCIYCDYPDQLRHWKIPSVVIDNVVINLNKFSIVFLTGGEPLISTDAIKLLTVAAQNNNPNIQLVSNLNIKHPGIVDLLIKGSQFITCSLDAAKKETYQQLRQNSNWDTVIDNLKNIVLRKKELNQNYPNIEINFIINKLNYTEMFDFYELALSLGVDGICFKWMYDIYTPRMTEKAKIRTNKDLDVMLHISNTLIEICNNVKTSKRLVLNFSPVLSHLMSVPEWAQFYKATDFSDLPSYRFYQEEITYYMPDSLMKCRAPFNRLQFNSFEYVSFCCYSKGEYDQVKINYEDGLYGIWNNKKFQQARRCFLDGEYSKVCRPECIDYLKYVKKRAES